MLRQVSLDAAVFFFFFRNVNCSNKHKIIASCTLSFPAPFPSPSPPSFLQPAPALSVPWPSVWPPWLFV